MKSYRALREIGHQQRRLLTNSVYREEHRRLDRGQWDDPTTVAERQTGMLGKLLSHAVTRVPHYRRLAEERSLSLGTDPRRLLAAFPPLTRRDLESSLRNLITTDWPLSDLGIGHTSGSTGRPVSFYRTQRSLVGAEVGRCWAESLGGYRPGMRQAVLWGSKRDLGRRVSARSWWERRIGGRQTFNTSRLPVARLENMVRELRRHGTEYLYGYASSMFQFARFCRREGVSFDLAGMQTTADSLHPSMRETIEEVLGAHPSDRYASRELGVIAAGCPDHGSMHVAADQKLVEVIGDDGEPARPGEIGRILVTDLLNFGMPLIRYDLGDLGIAAADPCSCRRGYPLLARVVGRSGDLIVTAQGRHIDPERFTRLLGRREEVEQFQVIQKSAEDLEVVVAAAPGAIPDLQKALESILQGIAPGFRIEFREVREIPPSPSGRFSYTANPAVHRPG